MGLAVQTGRFVSLFTATQPPTTQGPTGNLIGDWTPIAGLTNIPCTAPPPLVSRIQAGEKRNPREILNSEFKHVLLSAWYPQLKDGIASGWRCTIDGEVYLPLGAESDSQMTQTRVHIALVQLGGTP